MQAKPRQVHVLRPAAQIERRKNVPQFLDMRRCLLAPFRPAFIACLEAAMAERSDQAKHLACRLSDDKWQSPVVADWAGLAVGMFRPSSDGIVMAAACIGDGTPTGQQPVGDGAGSNGTGTL